MIAAFILWMHSRLCFVGSAFVTMGLPSGSVSGTSHEYCAGDPTKAHNKCCWLERARKINCSPTFTWISNSRISFQSHCILTCSFFPIYRCYLTNKPLIKRRGIEQIENRVNDWLLIIPFAEAEALKIIAQQMGQNKLSKGRHSTYFVDNWSSNKQK